MRFPSRLRFPPLGPGFWQAAAILAPLLLLAALGVRGLQVSQQAALADARQQAQRALDQGWPAAWDKWQRTLRDAETVRLYPSLPIPAPPSEAQARYEHALALMDADPARADAELARLETDSPDAPAASGVPLLPLVTWARLRLAAPDPDAALMRAQAFRQAAVKTHPSILTPKLLAAEHEPSPVGAPSSRALSERLLFYFWRQMWGRDEGMRAVLRLNAARISAHGAGWFGARDDRGRLWVIVRAGADADVRMLPPPALEEAADSMATTKIFLPDYELLTARLEGELLTPGGLEAREVLARREQDGLALTIVLADPERLYARQRQQALWLAALLLSALLAGLAGLRAMRRALARERRLGQLKSDFVSSVSHELRAPVASMRLMAENLENGAVPTEARRAEYHHHIAEECRRLSALIDNVLDFARIEQDRKTYDFAETDAAALVRDAVQFMEPRAVRRRQTLSAELPPAPLDPPPACDGLAVRQALVNLLDNAIKFSPEGTPIRVRLRAREGSGAGEWEIAVRDEGPGIPAAEREAIFERFYRIGSELRRETQGAGIGLSIVRHVAQAHGGRVELQSQPGAGSEFALVLPLRPPGAN